MEVIILAGGLGTRLAGMVSDVPKCLAPISGRPFLWYLFDNIARCDVTRVILSLGYKGEQVKEWVERVACREFSFRIECLMEETPLGTGGALKLALAESCEDDVVVMNGDTLFRVDMERLMSAHRASGRMVTIALKPMKDFSRYGAVDVDYETGVVCAFREKEYCADGLINGGVYAVKRVVPFDGICKRKFSFEMDVLDGLSKLGNVGGIVQDGYFIDIGVPVDYIMAQNEIPQVFVGLTGADVSRYSAILLDRDGVINRIIPRDYVKRWDEFEFLPGIRETVSEWTRTGKKIFVVTNQRGVGKGLMTREALDDIHDRMCRSFSDFGGHIEKVYCCVAVDETDHMRKPNIGMFELLLSDYPEVRVEECLMIGDSDSDRRFAENCGIDFRRCG